MITKLQMIVLGFLLIALVMMTGLSQIIVFAQEATSTPEPGAVADGPIDPDIEATTQAVEAEWEQEYNSRNLLDFSVAYLIAPDATTSDSLISPQAFAELYGAQAVHSWDDFIAQDDLRPFQIILIHDSFYEQIDTLWTQQAYRNKVIIVGIAIQYEHLVEITGDHCLYNPNPQIPYDTRWLYFAYSVKLEDESYREYVNQQELEICDDDYSLGGLTLEVLHGLSNFPLTFEDGLILLRDNLKTETMTYGLSVSQDDTLPLPTAEATTLPVPGESSASNGATK